MKTNLTELVFILDRSGSMGGLESDTIGGFNAMLAKQQAESGECRLTTVLFDDEYEILHDRIDIKAVKPVSGNEYFVRGCTALLDALGRTISKIAAVQKNTAEDYRADKVLFVITTDGLENASREYDYDTIKGMVEQQKTEHGWEFLFLGANMDAIETAGQFGIAPNRSSCFNNDSEGIALNYAVFTDTISEFRASPADAAIDDLWCAPIQADYKRRSGKASTMSQPILVQKMQGVKAPELKIVPKAKDLKSAGLKFVPKAKDLKTEGLKFVPKSYPKGHPKAHEAENESNFAL